MKPDFPSPWMEEVPTKKEVPVPKSTPSSLLEKGFIVRWDQNWAVWRYVWISTSEAFSRQSWWCLGAVFAVSGTGTLYKVDRIMKNEGYLQVLQLHLKQQLEGWNLNTVGSANRTMIPNTRQCRYLSTQSLSFKVIKDVCCAIVPPWNKNSSKKSPNRLFLQDTPSPGGSSRHSSTHAEQCCTIWWSGSMWYSMCAHLERTTEKPFTRFI